MGVTRTIAWRAAAVAQGKETGMSRILIVDDEPHIRMLLEEALEELQNEGVELLFAENGVDALESIKATPPALVFLDVMMPKMNGFDVCRAVKQDQRLDGVHIVMLTAKGQEFDKRRGQDAGADKYMTKPFNPIAVIQTAREVLKLES
jgi:DNA-binding response OmpR family regulator